MNCGLCGVPASDYAYCCWWCSGFLCSICWDGFGHCGHPEAEAVNERGRRGRQPGEPLRSMFDAGTRNLTRAIHVHQGRQLATMWRKEWER